MDGSNSVCQDEFEVSNLVNGNFRVPIICGYNTGEHSKLFNLILIQINIYVMLRRPKVYTVV